MHNDGRLDCGFSRTVPTSRTCQQACRDEGDAPRSLVFKSSDVWLCAQEHAKPPMAKTAIPADNKRVCCSVGVPVMIVRLPQAAQTWPKSGQCWSRSGSIMSKSAPMCPSPNQWTSAQNWSKLVDRGQSLAVDGRSLTRLGLNRGTDNPAISRARITDDGRSPDFLLGKILVRFGRNWLDIDLQSENLRDPGSGTLFEHGGRRPPWVRPCGGYRTSCPWTAAALPTTQQVALG